MSSTATPPLVFSSDSTSTSSSETTSFSALSEGKEIKIGVLEEKGDGEQQLSWFGQQLQKPSHGFIVVWIILFCILGTGLTFVNKLCMEVFPFTNTLLTIQCVITVFLVLGVELSLPGLGAKVNKLELRIVLRWLPLVLLFIGLLWSSLQALKYVSISTLVVIRNGSSLVVAFAEAFFFPQQRQHLTWSLILSLLGILLGSALYAATDWSFSVVGYLFLLINLLSTSGYQIYVKMLVRDLKLTPFGMVYYNNLLSFIYFAFVSILMETNSPFSPFSTVSVSISTYTWSLIIISSLFGFGLSLAAFVLNVILTATTQMVINNLNKLGLIFLSEFYQKNLDLRSGTSAAVVLLSAFYFSYLKTLPPASSSSISSSSSRLSSLFTLRNVVVVCFLVPLCYFLFFSPFSSLSSRITTLKEGEESTTLSLSSLSPPTPTPIVTLH